jgi:hypothetical protein
MTINRLVETHCRSTRKDIIHLCQLYFVSLSVAINGEKVLHNMNTNQNDLFMQFFEISPSVAMGKSHMMFSNGQVFLKCYYVAC